MEKILKRAKELEECHRKDMAIEYVMDYLEGELDDPELIDIILEGIDIKNISTQLLITILTCTLPIADRLLTREQFFNQCKEEVIKREGKIRPGLFDGLEGSNAKSSRRALNFIRRELTGEKEI